MKQVLRNGLNLLGVSAPENVDVRVTIKAGPTPSKKAGPFPGWAWFILGILVGLFSADSPGWKLLPAEEILTGAVTRSAPKEKPPAHEGTIQKPRLTFYHPAGDGGGGA